MSDIRKKYRKYWIVGKTCYSCDAYETDNRDCLQLGDCTERLNGKYPIYKLIKKAG